MAQEPPEVVAALGRSPFPSVNGNPPVYRARPFYDARRVEGAVTAAWLDAPSSFPSD